MEYNIKEEKEVSDEIHKEICHQMNQDIDKDSIVELVIESEQGDISVVGFKDMLLGEENKETLDSIVKDEILRQYGEKDS